ncbi:putative endonuclease 4 [Astathelohania contejeani]|uniref:Endonuclease 4 n=1 Tax=Astathelohania contejeani TaxID=164912 RepID=A0ABQ7HZH0_9MICR|nr:putative endonuclease 4 [Thelohania contejeani]
MGKRLLGAHLSIAKGLYTLQSQMEAISGTTCAFFLKNQRRYDSKMLSNEEIYKFNTFVTHPEILLPHGSYLINLANPDPIIHEKSMNCLEDDLVRCDKLGVSMYNLHPGSDVKKLGKRALEFIAKNINTVLRKVPNVMILLENMAGQGTVVGGCFQDLAHIISIIEDKSRIGVCLDTCHLFGSGYDIRTADKFQRTMDEFDKIVGIKYLKAMHLNDSKEPLGSKKDRHECIGKGHIGIGAFEFIMTNPIFEGIPLILETPNPELYGEEIKLLKDLENK